MLNLYYDELKEIQTQADAALVCTLDFHLYVTLSDSEATKSEYANKVVVDILPQVLPTAKYHLHQPNLFSISERRN